MCWPDSRDQVQLVDRCGAIGGGECGSSGIIAMILVDSIPAVCLITKSVEVLLQEEVKWRGVAVEKKRVRGACGRR